MPLSPGRASSHPSPSSSHRDAQLHPASVPAFLPPRAAALAAPGGSHYRPCPPGVAGKGLGSIPGSARPLPRRGLIGQLSPNGKQMEPGVMQGKPATSQPEPGSASHPAPGCARECREPGNGIGALPGHSRPVAARYWDRADPPEPSPGPFSHSRSIQAGMLEQEAPVSPHTFPGVYQLQKANV